jgi:hypothetical protein
MKGDWVLSEEISDRINRINRIYRIYRIYRMRPAILAQEWGLFGWGLVDLLGERDHSSRLYPIGPSATR